jgi:hypothetical protein
LKLLLSGCEPDDDDEESFPLRLPGVNQPLTTRSVKRYYTAELFHYLDFYHKVKQFGLPFKNFLESPAWVLQLHGAFDGVYREMERRITGGGTDGGAALNPRPRIRRPHIRRR